MLPSCSQGRQICSTLPVRSNLENVTSTARWAVHKTLPYLSTTIVRLSLSFSETQR
jgi:hypothetical protein